MSDTRAVAMLLILACMWSSSFTAIKYVIEVIPPLTLVAVRLSIASLFLYTFMKFRGLSFPAWGRSWWPIFMIGLTGNSLPFFLISWGEIGISSAQAVILLALMPLATLVLAHFLTATDKITATKLIGLMIGFGGMVLLFGPGMTGEQAGQLPYRLAIVGAAICYAMAAVQVRRLPKTDTPIVNSTAMMICATIQTLPLSLLLDQPWSLTPDTDHIITALYLGLVPTALAAILYFRIITDRGTTFFAVINYIIPCLGILWGYLFLGEAIGVQAFLALGVILTGVAIANVRRAPRAAV